MELLHHGGTSGVTGSCHQVNIRGGDSLLIDCGAFQGAEASGNSLVDDALDLDVSHLKAVILTHCHLDHVGRVPALLAMGYRGPIFASAATVELLPLVLEDAMRLSMQASSSLRRRYLQQLEAQLVPVEYNQWHIVAGNLAQICLRPAGHILGSAVVEIDSDGQRWVFSGDIGPKHTPLLPDPVSPERADLLVLESTYGNRVHIDRMSRNERLRAILERTLINGGVTLIPAFAVGRTQELLYEIEQILYQIRAEDTHETIWRDIPIIIDSPMAAQFTRKYAQLKRLWDSEAKQLLADGRHPLDFENRIIIDEHDLHLQLVNRLARTGEPAIVIAASGMCVGGRVTNYLKALLGDERTDVVFVGYQASGTPGREIELYGPRGGWVELDGRDYEIRAQIHSLSGFSAHADREQLVEFVTSMGQVPTEIRLVHGEPNAQRALKQALMAAGVRARITCGCELPLKQVQIKRASYA